MPALFAGVVWDSILDGSMRSIIERQALVPFLQRQRWFGGKARPLAAARFVDWATLRKGAHPAFLTIVEAAVPRRRTRALRRCRSPWRAAPRPPPSSSSTPAACSRASPARARACSTTASSTMGRARRCWRRSRKGGRRRRAPDSVRAADIGLTAERAPADALAPIARSAAGPEQYLGAVRTPPDHEAVPAGRAGAESGRRDRRVPPAPRLHARAAAPRHDRVRGGDEDGRRWRCCRSSSGTRATGGRSRSRSSAATSSA